MRPRRVTIACLGVLGLGFAAACGGDDDGDGNVDAGGIDVSGLTYEPCQPAAHVGGFIISQWR